MDEKQRRVLCIGGPLDGKWRSTQDPGRRLRVLKPVRISLADIGGEVTAYADVKPPDYDIYHLERIVLFGEGVWVGIHGETLDRADREGTYRGRDAWHAMILRAILQRDVATEMGL